MVSTMSDSVQISASKDRRILKDRRRQVAREILKETSDATNVRTAIYFAVSLIMILIGIKVCILTGLINPFDPTVEQIGITGSISLLYVGLFKHGLLS